MSYNAYSPTYQYHSKDLYHRFQQTSWNFEAGEDRTSITSPSPSNEITLEATFVRSFYWAILDVLVSTQSGYYFGGRPLSSAYDLEREIQKWQERTTSAISLSETQLQSLKKHYVFRDEVEVKSTLREYPSLVQLLLDTHSRIEAHFPGSQVFLEVSIDYEASDQYPMMTGNYKELVISISTSLSPRDAMKALREFYDNWWLKVSENVKRNVSVGLEFV